HRLRPRDDDGGASDDDNARAAGIECAAARQNDESTIDADERTAADDHEQGAGRCPDDAVRTVVSAAHDRRENGNPGALIGGDGRGGKEGSARPQAGLPERSRADLRAPDDAALAARAPCERAAARRADRGGARTAG